jgi:hypothetical protein
VINTPLGRDSFFDERAIRREALEQGIACLTTIEGAREAAEAIRALRAGTPDVESLQEIHALSDVTTGGTAASTAGLAEASCGSGAGATGERERRAEVSSQVKSNRFRPSPKG